MRQDDTLSKGEITPESCRAARGWLNWTQRDLAENSGVSRSMIAGFETRRHEPTFSNIKAIRASFELAGVMPTVDDNGETTGIACIARYIDKLQRA